MQSSPKTNWWPFILQALVVLAAAWSYVAAQDRRVAVMEEQVHSHTEILELHRQTLEEQQKLLSRLLALEEYYHRSPGR